MSKQWYILQVFAGYEKKIERRLNDMLNDKEIDPDVLTTVKVPIEEVEEIKDGKKRKRSNMLLPGYVMLEMDLPEESKKMNEVCSSIRRIQGVNGFVGVAKNERPRPISSEEAKNLLQKSGDIKGEKTSSYIKHSFAVGDEVKITEGAFATFSGVIEEISSEKDKMRVNVQIFGRMTPVEVNMLQVEKVI